MRGIVRLNYETRKPAFLLGLRLVSQSTLYGTSSAIVSRMVSVVRRMATASEVARLIIGVKLACCCAVQVIHSPSGHEQDPQKWHDDVPRVLTLLNGPDCQKEESKSGGQFNCERFYVKDIHTDHLGLSPLKLRG
jgi:hypothetical protein